MRQITPSQPIPSGVLFLKVHAAQALRSARSSLMGISGTLATRRLMGQYTIVVSTLSRKVSCDARLTDRPPKADLRIVPLKDRFA